MMNELNPLGEYKDYTKYSGFAKEIERIINDIYII